MSKGLKIALIVLGSLAGIALLIGGGIFIGRALADRFNNNPYGMMGYFNGGNGSNPGNQTQNFKDQRNNPGFGMMNRNGSEMGQGRMGRSASKNYSGAPISVDTARQAAEKYLSNLNNTDLTVKEIMVFNNNAYVAVVEKSTGKGAMELLVNPITLSVTPEMGPNRMWNLKYGMMGQGGCGSYGMMGSLVPGTAGRQGGCIVNPPSNQPINEMTITPEQARQDAQSYLDKNITGTQAAEDPLAFYGYYTLDYMKDGKPVGMLSVNGYTGKIWLHTWHGTFIEEWQAK
jgi:hypothetical protein